MKPERFNALASVMIAVVTVLGAAVACLASVSANEAGNADFDGLTAAINAEETTIVNSITTYEHYQAYTTYQRYNELGNVLHDEAAIADPAAAESLNRLKREVWGLALGLQYTFFPPRYLNPDGTYNTQRELDESWAEAAQQNDLAPLPHFEEADALRLKANLLTSVLIPLAVAFWFFTCAQAIKNRIKYLLGIAGFVFTFISLLFVLMVEVLL